jgi:hypothetical protein
MTGHWIGFAHSAGDADLRGGFTLDVTSQRARRFSGEVGGVQARGGMAVVGTISRSGHLTMRGEDSSANSNWVADVERPDDAFGGRYKTRSGASHDEGNVVAAHLVPDSSAPSFAGDWSGHGTSSPSIDNSDNNEDGIRCNPDFDYDRGIDVAANGRLTQDLFGGIGGNITWRTAGDDPQTFDIAGQAFGDDGADTGGLVLVGSSDRALIVIRLHLPAPGSPDLEGSYVLLNDSGKPACEDGSLTLAPTDGGVGGAP